MIINSDRSLDILSHSNSGRINNIMQILKHPINQRIEFAIK